VRFDVVTIFPGMFAAVFEQGVVGRAIERGLLVLHAHDLRDHTHDRHRQVDDMPFGGGPGMVIKPEPVFEAVESISKNFIVPLMEKLLADGAIAHDRDGHAGLHVGSVGGKPAGTQDVRSRQQAWKHVVRRDIGCRHQGPVGERHAQQWRLRPSDEFLVLA